jgi:hypothetical protein
MEPNGSNNKSMNKKTILFLMLIIVGGVVVYFKYIYGWLEFRKNTDTPAAFLNLTKVSAKNYSKDSMELVTRLRELLIKREGFFDNTGYFDATHLMIDSIIYSPDLQKLAAFVLVKNPTYRQRMPDKKYTWYYDGTCYLGERKADTILLSWIGPVFTNSYNKEDISENIREDCFRRFATKDTASAYRYNINDIRFWNSSIWRKVEEEREKRRLFEGEKKNHPENVYEPPKK